MIELAFVIRIVKLWREEWPNSSHLQIRLASNFPLEFYYHVIPSIVKRINTENLTYYDLHISGTWHSRMDVEKITDVPFRN